METMLSFIARCEANSGLKYDDIPRSTWDAEGATSTILCRRGDVYLLAQTTGQQDDDGCFLLDPRSFRIVGEGEQSA